MDAVCGEGRKAYGVEPEEDLVVDRACLIGDVLFVLVLPPDEYECYVRGDRCDDYEKRIPLAKANFEKYGKMFVNTLIMKDELARLAAMKETQVISTENGLFILKAEADFFRLYCFVDGREPEKAITGFLEHNRFDCPIVFDLVGRKKRIEKLKQHLNENAISPYAEYDRYILTDRITPRGFYQQLTDPDTIRFGFSEAKDAERTTYLESLGLRVMRFSNHDVDTHFNSVCETIDAIIRENP